MASQREFEGCANPAIKKRRNKVLKEQFASIPFRESPANRGYPSPPPSPNPAPGAGFTKAARKILGPRDLGVKILRTKYLLLRCAACMYRFRLGNLLLLGFQGQGQMSHRACGNSRNKAQPESAEVELSLLLLPSASKPVAPDSGLNSIP